MSTAPEVPVVSTPSRRVMVSSFGDDDFSVHVLSPRLDGEEWEHKNTGYSIVLSPRSSGWKHFTHRKTGKRALSVFFPKNVDLPTKIAVAVEAGLGLAGNV